MRDSWAAMQTDEGSDALGEGAEDGIPCFAGFTCVWWSEVHFSFEGWYCHSERLEGQIRI